MKFKLYPVPSGISTPDKRFTLVFCNPNDQNLEDFLEKILQAVGIELKTQVDLVWYDSRESLPLKPPYPEKVLYFGVLPTDTGIHAQMPEYEVTWFRQSRFLIAENLEFIHQDQAKKKRLWMALQNLFPK